MERYEETQVEHPFIEQLKRYEYTYLTAMELDQERSSQAAVLLEERFRNSVHRLNPWISDNNLDKVVRRFATPQAEDLWHMNKQIFDWLFGEGITVVQDLGSGNKNQSVQLFDYDIVENNDFVVTNQFTVTNAMGTIIPDIVIFVNGLPLVLVECKSPKLSPEKQLPEAYRQIERYVREHEKLFWYNQIIILTSRDRAKAATLFTPAKHYSVWKDPYPLSLEEVGSDSPQDILVAGMLRKEVVLDLLRNFIVYDGKTMKLARYQQYRAVNKAIERIEQNEKPSKRGGVVWHTQGSGKSLTMIFLSKKLRRIQQLKNPMIAIVTDRTDLDNQITATFRDCGFSSPQQAQSVEDLKLQLSKGQGTTVMTLIAKFQENGNGEFPLISESDNIIVMTDESHRSQYKTFALNMRKALPNATFIGFTGTPIDKKERSTTGTFGAYIDKYTIEQAVADGATVPIFYESRLPDLQVRGDSLDELFNRSFSEYDEEEKEKIKQKYVTNDLVLTSPERMRDVALDMVKHFEEKVLVNGYKAQVVAVSRKAAAKYKELIDSFSNGKFETAVIISNGHNDGEELASHHKSKPEERALIERFKKPFEEDKLAMLIVCDKLLTGFDAPVEQVMYLDKPLKEHNLLQAVARTNRRYDDNKSYGLIVDYFGVSRFLDEALAVFSSNDIEGALHSIDEEIPRLEQRQRQVMRYFDGLKPEQREEAVLRLSDENVRTDFDLAYKRFAESMDRVLPNPKAGRFLPTLKWTGTIRQLTRSKFAIDDAMDISECGEKVRQIVQDYIHSNGIIAHDPISILDASFKADVEANTKPETKAAQMEHAIKKEISVKMQEDEVFYTSLKEKVKALVEEYKNRQLTIEELLEELEKTREELVKKAAGKTDSGLTSLQEPYYNKLVEVIEDGEEKKLKKLAISLHDFIENRVITISDWTKKVDFKRQLTADMKLKLLLEEIDVEDAAMLTGYFMSLAETQYGNR